MGFLGFWVSMLATPVLSDGANSVAKIFGILHNNSNEPLLEQWHRQGQLTCLRINCILRIHCPNDECLCACVVCVCFVYVCVCVCVCVCVSVCVRTMCECVLCTVCISHGVCV